MKKRTDILIASIAVVIAFLIVIVANSDSLTTKVFGQSKDERYVTFLKKHEQEMTDKVKEKNPKVTSVQWDWDSVDAGDIGNGLPWGGGKALTLHGKFNEIENSSFYVQFDLDKNEDIEFETMMVDTLRVGGEFYE